jgi:hypothetical protein
MSTTKQQSINKPKFAGLSNKEKEKRWAQYKMSQRANKMPGRTTSTRVRVRNDALHLKMTPCAVDYAKALVTPFSLSTAACIPDLHAVPSKKVRVKTRGVFSTGVGGNGQLIMVPWCTANDTTLIFGTDAASNIGPLVAQAGAGITFFPATKLPYKIQDFASFTVGGIRARLVGAGVRIRYIGPEISRSGQIVGFREPDNTSCTSLSFDRIRSLATSKTFSNKRQWTYCSYRPVQPSEYEYSPFPCSPESASKTSSSFDLTQGFVISGTTDSSGNPGPAPFEFEAIQFIEYIGNIDNITHTHVDVVGMSHVRNALPGKSVTDSMLHTAKEVAHNLESSLKSAAPAIGAGVLGYHLLAKGSSSEAAGLAAEEASSAASGGFFSTIKHFGSEALDWLGAETAEAASAMGPVGELIETVAPFALAA